MRWRQKTAHARLSPSAAGSRCRAAVFGRVQVLACNRCFSLLFFWSLRECAAEARPPRLKIERVGSAAVNVEVEVLVVDFLVLAIGADGVDGAFSFSRRASSPLRTAMPDPSPWMTGSSGSMPRILQQAPSGSSAIRRERRNRRRRHRCGHWRCRACIRPRPIELQLGLGQVCFGIVGMGGGGLGAQRLAGKARVRRLGDRRVLGTTMAEGVL